MQQNLPAIRSACLIHCRQDGKFLLVNKPKAGRDGWIFPGGKIQPGETPEMALKREIETEELPGTSIAISKFWKVLQGRTRTDQPIMIRAYFGSIIGASRPSAEIRGFDYFSLRELFSDQIPTPDMTLVIVEALNRRTVA